MKVLDFRVSPTHNRGFIVEVESQNDDGTFENLMFSFKSLAQVSKLMKECYGADKE